jgi:DNA-binding response OmpR family regulator
VVVAVAQIGENHHAELTTSEAAILAHLMKHPETIFSCHRLTSTSLPLHRNLNAS